MSTGQPPPTLAQFEQAIYASYQFGDQTSTAFLQSFQRSDHVWDGINTLFSVQQPSIQGLELTYIHHCASYIALDKVRSEWKTVKSNISDEMREQIKTMLSSHFTTIISRIQAGFYTRFLSTSHAILSNLAQALSTIAVLDRDCESMFNFAMQLQSTSPAIALILLTTLADVEGSDTRSKISLSNTTMSSYESFLRNHLNQVMTLCESFLHPLTVLLNRDLNPASFSPLSASLMDIVPDGAPLTNQNDLANCETVSIRPFYNQPTQSETYFIDPFRSLQTLTPLVPIRTYLQIPTSLSSAHFVSKSDLLFLYTNYPAVNETTLSTNSNIITLSLRCVQHWVPHASSLSFLMKAGNGLLLHYILALLPFDQYTPISLQIIKLAMESRMYPLPSVHTHAFMLVSKVMVEYSLLLQSRMLFAWVQQHINTQGPSYNQLNQLAATHTERDGIGQQHLTALLHAKIDAERRAQQNPAFALPNITKAATNLNLLLSQSDYDEIITTQPNHPLTLQQIKYGYFYPPRGQSSNDPHTHILDLCIFDNYTDLEQIYRHLRLFIDLIIGLMELESRVMINSPRPMISLTNFILLTLSHPQLSYSLTTLDFFVAIQDVLFQKRGYTYQQPLFVAFFIIVSLQLVQPGLAFLWLTKNPDIFDAIGTLGTTKYDQDDDEEEFIRDTLPTASEQDISLPELTLEPYKGEYNYSQLQSQYEQTINYIGIYQQQFQGKPFGALPHITQKMVSQLPNSSLQKVLLTNLNFSPGDFLDIDCTTIPLFTSEFFLNVAYDDYNSNLEQNRMSYIATIKESMYDLYKIFDTTLITFFFRLLGLHLPISNFLKQPQNEQSQQFTQQLSSLQFLAPFILGTSPNNPNIPNFSLLSSTSPPHLTQQYQYPSTDLVCNDGTLLDTIQLLPFPVNTLTQEPVSFLEFYSYLQHVPLTPTYEQSQYQQQYGPQVDSFTNNTTIPQNQQNIPRCINIGHYIPYNVPDIFGYNVYIAFTQSVLHLLCALSVSCAEGFSETSKPLDIIFSTTELSTSSPNPDQTQEDYLLQVVKHKFSPKLIQIHTVALLMYRLIDQISVLPVLPSFCNNPKHSSFNLKQSIGNKGQYDYQYNSNNLLTFIQPLSFQILPLLSNFSFILPILHPTTLTYTVFFIHQCISRGSQSLIQYLHLMNPLLDTKNQLSFSHPPTSSIIVDPHNGITDRTLPNYSPESFLLQHLSTLNSSQINPSHLPILSLFILSQKELELSPTQIIPSRQTKEFASSSKFISFLSTPPPAFTFHPNGRPSDRKDGNMSTLIDIDSDEALIQSDQSPAQLARLASVVLGEITRALTSERTVIFSGIIIGSSLIENHIQHDRMFKVQEVLHRLGLYITSLDSHFTHSYLPSFSIPNIAQLYLLNTVRLSPLIQSIRSVCSDGNGTNTGKKTLYFDTSPHVPVFPFMLREHLQAISERYISIRPVDEQLNALKLQQLKIALSASIFTPFYLPQCTSIISRSLSHFTQNLPATISHFVITGLLCVKLTNFNLLANKFFELFQFKLETSNNSIEQLLKTDNSMRLYFYIFSTLSDTFFDTIQSMIQTNSAFSTSFLYGTFTSDDPDFGISTSSQIMTSLLPIIPSLLRFIPVFNQVDVLTKPEVTLGPHLLNSLAQFATPPTSLLAAFQAQLFALNGQSGLDKQISILLHTLPLYHQTFLLSKLPAKQHIIETNEPSSIGLIRSLSTFITNAVDICPNVVLHNVPPLLQALSNLSAEIPQDSLSVLFEEYLPLLTVILTQIGPNNTPPHPDMIKPGVLTKLKETQMKISMLWEKMTPLVSMFAAIVSSYAHIQNIHPYFIQTLESIVGCILDSIYLHSFLNEAIISLESPFTSTPTVSTSATIESLQHDSPVSVDTYSLPLKNAVFSVSIKQAATLLSSLFSIITPLFSFRFKPSTELLGSLNAFLIAASNSGSNSLPGDYILHNKLAVNILLTDLPSFSFPLLLSSSPTLVRNLLNLSSLVNYHYFNNGALRETVMATSHILDSITNTQQFATFLSYFITQSFQYDPWLVSTLQSFQCNSPSQLGLAQLISTPGAFSLPLSLPPDEKTLPQDELYYTDAMAQLRIMGFTLLATINTLNNIDKKNNQNWFKKDIFVQLLTQFKLHPQLIPFFSSFLFSLFFIPTTITTTTTLIDPNQRSVCTQQHQQLLYSINLNGIPLATQRTPPQQPPKPTQSAQNKSLITAQLATMGLDLSSYHWFAAEQNDHFGILLPSLLQQNLVSKYSQISAILTTNFSTIINYTNTNPHQRDQARLESIMRSLISSTYVVRTIFGLNGVGSAQSAVQIPLQPLAIHILAPSFIIHITDTMLQQRLADMLLKMFQNVPQHVVLAWFKGIFIQYVPLLQSTMTPPNDPQYTPQVQNNTLLPHRFSIDQRVLLIRVFIHVIEKFNDFFSHELWAWHLKEVLSAVQRSQQPKEQESSEPSWVSMFNTDPRAPANVLGGNSKTPVPLGRLKSDLQSRKNKLARNLNSILKEIQQVLNSSNVSSFEQLNDLLQE